MKKYIYMFLLCVSCTAALGQDAPPLDAKVVSPNPTWYKKITGTDTSYYLYSGGQWAKFARSEWVKKLLQDGLNSAAKLDGTNFFSGYNNFQNLGARTIALSSYADTLIPGDVSAGNYKVSSSNSGPFIGNTSYRNKMPQFRWGERAGGGAFVVQKFNDGIWKDILVASAGGTDSSYVTKQYVDSLSNTYAKLNGYNRFKNSQLIEGKTGSNLTLQFNETTSGGGLASNMLMGLGNDRFTFQGSVPVVFQTKVKFASSPAQANTNASLVYYNYSTYELEQASSYGLENGKFRAYSPIIAYGGITNLPAPVNDNDAIRKRDLYLYLDSTKTANTYVVKNGGNSIVGNQTVDGDFSITGNIITGNNSTANNITSNNDLRANGSINLGLSAGQLLQITHDFFPNQVEIRNTAANNAGFKIKPNGDIYIGNTSSADGSNGINVIGKNILDSDNIQFLKQGDVPDSIIISNTYASKSASNIINGSNDFNGTVAFNGRVQFNGSAGINVGIYQSGGNQFSWGADGSAVQWNMYAGDNFGLVTQSGSVQYYFKTDGLYRSGNKLLENSGSQTIDGTLIAKGIRSDQGFYASTDNANEAFTAQNGLYRAGFTPRLFRVAEDGGAGANETYYKYGSIQAGRELPSGNRYSFTINYPVADVQRGDIVNFKAKPGVQTIAYESDIAAFVGDTAQYIRKSGGNFTGSIYLAHDAVADMEAVTRNQLYNLYNGLSWKSSVRAKAPGNVTLSGIQTIDGVSGLANGRYLLTNQTNAKENGIWLMQSDAWVRSTDADSGEELTGLTVSISLGGAGTRYSQWTYTGDANPIIGADNITFSQISGPGTYGAGTGLIASANLFLLDQTFVKGLFSASGPLTYTAGSFSIAQAGIGQDGYLSSSDYNTFAAKQAAGNYLTALTGEVIAAGPGSAAATISKSITPTWTGAHSFNGTLTLGSNVFAAADNTYVIGTNANNFNGINTRQILSNGALVFNTTAGNGIVYNIGGIEKLRISPANGNLLIGATTDDGSSKLQVNGQAVISGRTAINSSQGATVPAAFYIGTAPVTTSGAFNLAGFGINQQGVSYTSSATGSTIAQATINGYGQATVTHSNPTTITKMYGNYFRWATAGANTTITNNYAAGFAGDVEVTGQAFISSNTVIGNGVPNSKFTVYQTVDGVSGGASIFSTAGTNIRLWADATNARISGSGSENSNVVINGTGTGQVLIGTTTTDGVSRFQVNGQTSINGALIPASNNSLLLGGANNNWLSVYTNEINRTGANTYLNFRLNGIDQGRWFTNTGNLVIGGTTDAGTGKFQVVGSISATTDISVLASDRGLILKSPDGTRYRVTVANGGTLQTTAL